jgi:hypothetical protein
MVDDGKVVVVLLLLRPTAALCTPRSSAVVCANVVKGVVMGFVGSGFASVERAAEIAWVIVLSGPVLTPLS